MAQKRKFKATLSGIMSEIRYDVETAPQPISIVAVLVRGDISFRIFSTWQTQIPKKLNAGCIRIVQEFDNGAEWFVLPGSCSKDTLDDWSKHSDLSSRKLLKPSFLIECLKSNKIVDWNDHVHPLSSTLKRDIISDDSNEAFKLEPAFTIKKEESPEKPMPKRLSKEEWKAVREERMKNSFACARSGLDTSSNANRHITDILDDLQKIYELSGDQWRAMGYKKCSSMLKTKPQITHIEQVDGMKGVGKSIRDKIAEILESGRLKKLQYFQEDPRLKSIQELSNIWGVGEKTAETLIKKGFHNIEELRKGGVHLLNPQQVIGLRHYEDLLTKISRAEVEEIRDAVTEQAQRIVPGVECIVCGSYRRGKPQSGDVDILIGPPPGVESMPDAVLFEILFALDRAGFLTDHLALPHGYYEYITPKYLQSTSAGTAAGDTQMSRSTTQQHSSSVRNDILSTQVESEGEDGDGSLDGSDVSVMGYVEQERDKDKAAKPGKEAKKYYYRRSARGSYMGVCRVLRPEAVHRRLDIKIYPRRLMPFALLYFTGSDHFNRSMRLFARKKGYTLNDKGLATCVRDGKWEKVATGQFTPCSTEREIFEALGLPYKEPWERNVFDTAHLMSEEEKQRMAWRPPPTRSDESPVLVRNKEYGGV